MGSNMSSLKRGLLSWLLHQKEKFSLIRKKLEHRIEMSAEFLSDMHGIQRTFHVGRVSF